MIPWGDSRIAISFDFCPASSVISAPAFPGPRAPYCPVTKPLRSADSRYFPGRIPPIAKRPAASVELVWLTWMLVTPGEESIRRKYTNARRRGSPLAAFVTWPLIEHESSGLTCPASEEANANPKSMPIQRMS